MSGADIGRLSGHVLLDTVSGWSQDHTEEQQAATLGLALCRLHDIDAVTATLAGDVLTVDITELAGGALLAVGWLTAALAEERGVDPAVVVHDVRLFLDGQLPPPLELPADSLRKLEEAMGATLAWLASKPAPPPATLDELRVAVEAGQPCARLVEIRRAMGPKHPDREAANELLRQVGCFGAGSSRA